MNMIINRVKNLLFSPKAEWEKINSEDKTSVDIVKEYLIYLIAIPVIAQFLRHIMFGYFLKERVGFFTALIMAIVTFILIIIGMYIAAYIINALAPSFNAQKDEMAAFKLVAYSYTASAVASIFVIFPILSILSLLGLYSVYLFYVGLPILMQCPKEKVLAYTVVSFLVMLGVYILIMLISVVFLC
ncbi:DUF1282 domain-containing protein [candidate division KSB1 bacterium]|nr:DUF1282 domain-containing protein [candidate division KSB1 bacterium]